jgi:glyceraldehyde 3-phosphate dehydrogenase
MMESSLKNKNLLGINGMGRIGKLTFWNHLVVRHFDGYVINAGREVGRSLKWLYGKKV